MLNCSLLVKALFLIGCLFAASSGQANEDARAAFAATAFPSAKPTLASLWLNADLKAVLHEQFDYSAHKIRMRYWQNEQRTAWILEEVGKEKPITIGVVIDGQRIVEIEVLVYRESRGEDIRYPFFRKQFYGAELVDKKHKPELTESIDGITGATLSVRAMEKVAKVALFLHQTVTAPSLNE